MYDDDDCFFVFGCKYRCNHLLGKTCDLLCVEYDVKLYTLTHIVCHLFIHPQLMSCWLFSFCVQKMEVELNAEREKLLADKMLVESELKTVNKDLSTQLTTAKSQVDNYKKCISNVFSD